MDISSLPLATADITPYIAASYAVAGLLLAGILVASLWRLKRSRAQLARFTRQVA
jgi:heme exporter protein CcmD